MQTLLNKVFGVPPSISQPKAGMSDARGITAMLSELQSRVQMKSANVAELAEREAVELRMLYATQAFRLPDELVLKAAAVHLDIVKMCSSASFVLQNGLYCEQHLLLKQWLR